MKQGDPGLPSGNGRRPHRWQRRKKQAVSARENRECDAQMAEEVARLGGEE